MTTSALRSNMVPRTQAALGHTLPRASGSRNRKTSPQGGTGDMHLGPPSPMMPGLIYPALTYLSKLERQIDRPPPCLVPEGDAAAWTELVGMDRLACQQTQ